MTWVVTFVFPHQSEAESGVLIGDKLFGMVFRSCTHQGPLELWNILNETDCSYLVEARLFDLAKHTAAVRTLCHWCCAAGTATRNSASLDHNTRKMTPPCRSFHASDLPLQIQIGPDGKRRKTEGGKPIDLKACKLQSLVQYACQVERPASPDSVIRCYPVQRWFRRYG